jgi:hypothetical protein
MIAGKALTVVVVKVNPEKEEGFNHFYHNEHIPEFLHSFPEILRAKRYVCTSQNIAVSEHPEGVMNLGKHYLTVYEFPSEEVQHQVFERVQVPGRKEREAWDKMASECLTFLSRNFYTEIYSRTKK